MFLGNMSKDRLKNAAQLRRARGATVVLVALAAFFILLPLGLFSFEISRVSLAQHQLQNAVDASALAAASGKVNGLKDPDVKESGLTMFRRNQVTVVSLKPAYLSKTAETDNARANKSIYGMEIDDAKGRIKAVGAFGYVPAFANILGLGPVTIRATAYAGTKNTGASGFGDIVIALDISDSIKGGCGINAQPDGSSSKSWVVRRHTNVKGTVPKFTYTTVTKSAGKGMPPKTIQITPHMSNSPAGLHLGGNFYHAIPNPAKVDFKGNSNAIFKKFGDKPLEEQVAFLVESKMGHLNELGDKSKFDPDNKVDKFHLGDTALKKYLPSVGDGTLSKGNDYRAAYDEAALPFVHPLYEEKRDLKFLVEQIVKQNPDANIALVGFAPRAGGHFKSPPKPKKGQPAPAINFPPEQGVSGSDYGYGDSAIGKTAKIPFVRFTKDHDKIIKSAELCTTFAGTNTTDALNVAHALLTENGRNLKGIPQACFLLTDGIPTVGGYKKAAKKFGKDGIPIKAIGYVWIGYSHRGGPKVCKKIVAQGGSGSQYIQIPYTKFNPSKKSDFKGVYTPGDNEKALMDAFNTGPALTTN